MSTAASPSVCEWYKFSEDVVPSASCGVNFLSVTFLCSEDLVLAEDRTTEADRVLIMEG